MPRAMKVFFARRTLFVYIWTCALIIFFLHFKEYYDTRFPSVRRSVYLTESEMSVVSNEVEEMYIANITTPNHDLSDFVEKVYVRPMTASDGIPDVTTRVLNSDNQLKSFSDDVMDQQSNYRSDFVRRGDDLKIPPPNTEKKIILYWTNWYNPKTSWENRMSPNDLPRWRHPDQRWVWVDVESPISIRGINGIKQTKRIGSHKFNWTMSYHISSDVMAMNGYLLPKSSDTMPLRANQLSYHKETLEQYLDARAKNSTLAQTMGPMWSSFVKRKKPVMWVSSNCKTFSKREEYVAELSKYIHVDKYGKCGGIKCGGSYMAFASSCWIHKFRKYHFALAFENSLCNHYLSEKPYNPLIYGLVPIVWGGNGYEEFLPPGSYINARQYQPQDLAKLIRELQNDPVAYGRYHVWRKFWRVMVRGSMCELCHKLHMDPVRGHHHDIPAWRNNSEQCVTPRSPMFRNGQWERVIENQTKRD